MLSWKKIYCERVTEQCRDRDGGMSKRLMWLIASTEREALSKFERSKILDKQTGGKRKLVTVNLQEVLLP